MSVEIVNDRELYALDEVEEAGETLLRYTSLADVDDLSRWIERIRQGRCPSVRGMLTRDDFKPKAMVLLVSLEHHTLYFLKTVNESALLKNKKIIKLFNQDAFTIDPDGSQNIVLDDTWDAVLMMDRLVLFRESPIFDLFKVYETVWADAQSALT